MLGFRLRDVTVGRPRLSKSTPAELPIQLALGVAHRTYAPNVTDEELELPRFGGHLIVSSGAQEGVPDGASVGVSSGVPPTDTAARAGVG